MKELHPIFILFTMIFMHIIDDFHLQGNLALFKQKKWWEENYPDDKYKHDYMISLLLHSFSWTFMIQLPIYLYTNNINIYIFAFIINWTLHSFIDHKKCNAYIFNLTQDQVIHIIQVIATFIVFIMLD